MLQNGAAGVLRKCTSRRLHLFDFLAPALTQNPVKPSIWFARFSLSASRQKRKRDNNPNRGVSAMRRTGLRYTLSVSKEPLPRPILDPDKRQKPTVDENHGLWEFFEGTKALIAPSDLAKHGSFSIETRNQKYSFLTLKLGRAWTMEELRRKSWEDLHRLWWICAKERNKVMTTEMERRRLKLPYGKKEADDRLERVRNSASCASVTWNTLVLELTR